MESAKFADVFVSWPQIEVIGVAEDDLRAEFFENVLRDSLNACDRANRHEHWSFNDAVRELHSSEASLAVTGFHCERERHWGDCNNALCFDRHPMGRRARFDRVSFCTPKVIFRNTPRQPRHYSHLLICCKKNALIEKQLGALICCAVFHSSFFSLFPLLLNRSRKQIMPLGLTLEVSSQPTLTETVSPIWLLPTLGTRRYQY